MADLTYVAIPTGFAYRAALLDAWSHKVVGYAISRSMEARVAAAALKAAINSRRPPEGCIHHSDRDSQEGPEPYRRLLAEHKPEGSTGRRGNPYDNAKPADTAPRHSQNADLDQSRRIPRLEPAFVETPPEL